MYCDWLECSIEWDEQEQPLKFEYANELGVLTEGLNTSLLRGS